MPKKRSLLDAATAVLQEEAAPAYPVPVPSQVLPEGYAGWVAVDTETSGLYADDGARTSTVSVAIYTDGPFTCVPQTGEGVLCYGFPFDQGPRDKLRVVQDSLFDAPDDPNLPRSEWEWLLTWLDDPRRNLVFHNAPFDLEKLRVGTRHWPGRELEHRFRWDTRLACSEIWPTEQTSLKPTSVRLWGPGEDQAQSDLLNWLKRNKLTKGDMDKAPWNIIGPYATKDAQQTLRLLAEQLALVEAGDASMRDIQLEFEKAKVIYRLSRRGLGYDAAGSLEAAGQIEELAAEARAAIPFEPTPAGAKAYFEAAGYGHMLKTTEKGNLSLDDEVLYAMIEREVPFADEYRRFTKLERANSMWYRGYAEAIGSDGRLRTYFRQAHVKSGRFSVERVQLQAIPKGDKDLPGIPGVRSFVRPAEGHQLWNLDLSQAELRVASKYSGCKRMLEMLEEGADLHTITTQEVMGVSPDDPDFKFQRDIGKRLTFGGIFQVGATTFQATLRKLAHIDLPIEQCIAIVKGWRQMYPEFGRAYRSAEDQVVRNGYVTLLRGTEWEKRSWFGPRDWPNTGWNRIVQGSLAGAVGLWLVEAERFLHDELGLEAMVLTVHDSIVLELPAEHRGLTDEQIVSHVADLGATLATRLFDIQMKVDTGSWYK